MVAASNALQGALCLPGRRAACGSAVLEVDAPDPFKPSSQTKLDKALLSTRWRLLAPTPQQRGVGQDGGVMSYTASVACKQKGQGLRRNSRPARARVAALQAIWMRAKRLCFSLGCGE